MADWFSYQKQQEEDQKEWASQGYVKGKYPNCGRERLEKCANGKHWCEKCNWVVEDKKFFTPECLN